MRCIPRSPLKEGLASRYKLFKDLPRILPEAICIRWLSEVGIYGIFSPPRYFGLTWILQQEVCGPTCNAVWPFLPPSHDSSSFLLQVWIPNKQIPPPIPSVHLLQESPTHDIWGGPRCPRSVHAPPLGFLRWPWWMSTSHSGAVVPDDWGYFVRQGIFLWWYRSMGLLSDYCLDHSKQWLRDPFDYQWAKWTFWTTFLVWDLSRVNTPWTSLKAQFLPFVIFLAYIPFLFCKKCVISICNFNMGWGIFE